jgi:hypothetical protein
MKNNGAPSLTHRQIIQVRHRPRRCPGRQQREEALVRGRRRAPAPKHRLCLRRQRAVAPAARPAGRLGAAADDAGAGGAARAAAAAAIAAAVARVDLLLPLLPARGITSSLCPRPRRGGGRHVRVRSREGRGADRAHGSAKRTRPPWRGHARAAAQQPPAQVRGHRVCGALSLRARDGAS